MKRPIAIKINKMRFSIILALAALMLAAGVTYALAQSEGEINACVSSTGTLRIVSDASQCKKNETPLGWNILGPKGDPGEIGPQGEPGPQGLACWDLNANGLMDEGEDINLDGVWDAVDCKGETGPAGPAGQDAPAGRVCDHLYLGAVFLHAGNVLPAGTVPADGRLLPINQNQALFSLYAITFGGDGRTTFALPNLPALKSTSVDGEVEGNVQYLICVTGPFPITN